MKNENPPLNTEILSKIPDTSIKLTTGSVELLSDELPITRKSLLEIKETLKNANPGLLGSEEIINYLNNEMLVDVKKSIGINNMDEIIKNVEPASIDLTIQSMYCTVKPNVKRSWRNPFKKQFIDSKLPMEIEENHFTMRDEIFYIDIPPGKMILMATREYLDIPEDITAFVCGRSSVARMGIGVEDAGLIDAGFKGTITLEIRNENNFPVRLYEKQRICQVYFLKNSKVINPYGSDKLQSKYQGQTEPTMSKINEDKPK